MKNILIVDDAPALLEAVSLILQLNGYRTTIATSEKELEHLIALTKPDLVLLDLHLGSEDGRTICRRLKSNAFTGMVPVILMSSSSKYSKKYQDYLADGFLEKPFHLRQLIETVQHHLQQQLQAS